MKITKDMGICNCSGGSGNASNTTDGSWGDYFG